MIRGIVLEVLEEWIPWEGCGWGGPSIAVKTLAAAGGGTYAFPTSVGSVYWAAVYRKTYILRRARKGGILERPLASTQPQELTGFCQEQLEDSQQLLANLLATGSSTNCEQTVLEPLNELFAKLNGVGGLVGLLRSVHPEESVRRAAEGCEQDLSRFAHELGLNRELYEVVRPCDTTPLDEDGVRFVERVLRDFRRSGVDKEEADRERVRALRRELVELGQAFTRNIVTDVRGIDVEELEGLPEDFVSKHTPGPDGKIRVTTDYPDYNPFMQYAKNPDSRRRLYTEFRVRAYPANIEVLDKIRARRHELATLLGFSSWAAYATEDKMIKTPEAVGAFLDRVSASSRARADREYGILLDQKRKEVADATEVFDWEKGYLEEQFKSQNFHVDSKALRLYFEYRRVKDGILSLTQDLFGVRFQEVTGAPRWHDDVEILDVFEGSERLGRIYLDMHPREGKFKHAAMFPVVSGSRGLTLPEAALVCNFPDPKKSQGPALLEHDDVVTFFHEFGHLLHQIFGGNQRWVEFSGCATEWDFVEVPSQLYEEWAWDYQVLQRFAVHHETGETIPEATVERLRAARDFGRGLAVCHQMFYASLSLACYDQDPGERDSSDLMRELQKKYSPFAFVEGTYFQASFGHLDEYSALYYTYMWSLVIVRDLCGAFKESGALSREAARRYREAVLNPGGSKDAVDLVRDFLGRAYTFDAFERWLNAS